MTQSIRLLVSSGNGPAECRIAVRHVLDRMRQEARQAGLSILVTVPGSGAGQGDKHGPASAIATIRGADAERFARSWSGTVQWICANPVRPKHRRRNWFVGIFPMAAQSARKVEIRRTDVRFEAFRAGGPGGQHQNKTDSAIRATHSPTGLSVVSRSQRSQHRNKEMALTRLSDKLEALESLARSSGRASENCLHGQLERGNPVRCFKGEAFEEV